MSEQAAETESIIDIIAHHLSATVHLSPIVKIPVFTIPGIGLRVDMSITLLTVLLWVAGLLVIVVALCGRRIVKHPLDKPTRLSGFVEVFVIFIRDEIVIDNMGEYGVKWTPYFITLFFFILFANLVGLFPASYTTTGNVAVTAGLSALSFLLIQFVGMLRQGWLAYWKNIVPRGVHPTLWIIMWPIEFFGLFTKPFALTIRLFANMTAGHVVIVVLLFMIIKFQSLIVAPLAVLGSVSIYLLEVFVCFIQAYIFVELTALFVGSAMHRH